MRTISANCVRCVYPRGEPKGERACKHCNRPENVTKDDWDRAQQLPEPVYRTVEDILGHTVESVPDLLATRIKADFISGRFVPPTAGISVGLFKAADALGCADDCTHPSHRQEEYGRSPSAEALEDMKAINELPPEQRARVSAATVRERLGWDEPVLTPFAQNVEEFRQDLAVFGSSSIVIEPTVQPRGHSKLGGSGAKRWMNCPGSTALIARLPPQEQDSEYAQEGRQAHALAARCLGPDGSGVDDPWEMLAEYPLLKFEDAESIQQYVDYVRGRAGRKEIEVAIHRPELHPDYFSTIDAAIYGVGGTADRVLEIVDFKFGVGVYVDVVGCEQLLYYAAGYIMGDPDFWPDEGVVRLTIVQSRLDWSDAPTIRSWDTTVAEIKRWLYDECLPAMRNTNADEFTLGDWCQFCPAKLVCPEQRGTLEVLDQAGDGASLLVLADAQLGELFEMSERVRTYQKALKDEVQRRMMDRGTVPGVKLVAGKADRVWKEEAEDKAKAKFGLAAYVTKMISPAVAEKLPGGKNFVAEYAFKPIVAPTVALAGDARKEVSLPTASQIFANVRIDDA